jgi:hypothetical protein
MAAFAALLIAVTLVPAGQAAADPNDGPKSDGAPRFVGIESLPSADQARQRAQEPLLNLNNRVRDVTADVYDEHFAGTGLDVQKKSLVVYWAGQVPVDLIGLRTEAAKSGITLTVKPARFSLQHLMAAAEQIMPTAEMPGSVEISNDGSGLTVAASDLPAVVRGSRASSAAEARLLVRIADVRSRSGIPVTVADKRPGKPQFDATIWDDRSPYWAGAYMEGCTSGFSMYASGAPSTRFTLTAAHCSSFTDGVEMRDGGGGTADIMGRTDFIHELFDVAPSYDLGVVRLNPGLTNQPSIYLRQDSEAGSIAVKGYASGGFIQGNYCVHAVYSVNCNLWSTGTTRRDCDFDWVPFNRCIFTVDMFSLDQDADMWCSGDSGGPIYYWSGAGVIATGVVSWSRHENGDCSLSGGASVVASAVNRINGLRVVTVSAP